MNRSHKCALSLLHQETGFAHSSLILKISPSSPLFSFFSSINFFREPIELLKPTASLNIRQKSSTQRRNVELVSFFSLLFPYASSLKHFQQFIVHKTSNQYHLEAQINFFSLIHKTPLKRALVKLIISGIAKITTKTLHKH